MSAGNWVILDVIDRDSSDQVIDLSCRVSIPRARHEVTCQALHCHLFLFGLLYRNGFSSRF